MADVLGPVEAGSSGPMVPIGRSENAGGNDGENPHPKKSMVKKRTKTGCLTCRRRRIKCDERRPTCNNCVKSKRPCDGYTQKLVFKNAQGFYQYSADSQLYPQHYPDYHLQQITPIRSIHGQLTPLAPKPTPYNQCPPQRYNFGFPQLNQGEAVTIASHSHPSYVSPHHNAQINMLAGSIEPESSFARQNTAQPCLLPIRTGNPPGIYAPPVQAGSSREQETRLLRSQNNDLLAATYEIDEEAALVDSDDDERPPNVAWGQFHTMSEYATFSGSGPGIDSAMTRHCLWNFIRSTGPSMSLYEREPFDPGQRPDEILQGSHRGESNQLWGLKFPMIAFHHPGLLHAMLALSCLQIAKRDDKVTYTAIAIKHCHLAIRRVAQNLGPSRRNHPATLAATLLLAYFEVWASDHQKWCKHLLGARQLLGSINLFEMSRKCLPLKMSRARQFATQRPNILEPSMPPENPEVLDFELLSILYGMAIPKTYYNLHLENQPDSSSARISEKDMDDYDNVRDLFWWYCKMDVYQSMLGGSRLLMNYTHWTQCPPRAPVGRKDMIYGTYDHLILLLGRLANFASNDLPRKKAASQAKGPPTSGASPLSFPGMIPVEPSVQVPPGFSPREPSPPNESPDEFDPESSLQQAVADWESIEAAFRVFEDSIKDVFKPLSSELADRSHDEPFGIAVQYETYSIAGIWMNFYMGLIHLHRSHPLMPPVAMQAAGIAAKTTEVYATMIGRIGIGMAPDLSKSRVTTVSSVMGAALIESAFCIFWAAVQYQHDNQRHWVVQRMRDIARLTGWQSANQIADGCESSWTRAAAMGSGPPYQSHYAPNSVWHNPRRLDRWISEVPDSERVIMLDQGPHFALGLLQTEGDDMVVTIYNGSQDEG